MTARALFLLVLAPAWCLAAASARADEAAPPLRERDSVGASENGVPLLGVTIDGASQFSHAELAVHYEQYLTRMVDLDDLGAIAQSISDRYRVNGYFLSRAVVPPDPIEGGIAHILVIEGRISEVRIEGAAADQVAPFLRGLTSGGPARLADIDHRLAMASDVPGVSINSRIEPDVDDPALHRLVVTASLKERAGYISLDNRGVEQAGPLQAFGRVVWNSALLDRDQIGLSVFTVPDAPEEFSLVQGDYSYAFGQGARFGASATAYRSQDGFSQTSPQLGGDGAALHLQLEQSLYRARRYGLWLGGQFDVNHLRYDRANGGGFVDELRVVRATLRGFLNEEGRASNMLVRASAGIDALGASEASPLRRSRPDADADFLKLDVFVSHYAGLSPHVALFAAVSAQLASEPLLYSEEFQAGGLGFGRGYDSGEISGDHGLAGLVELRAGYDPSAAFVSWLQAYALLDGAQVWNIDAGAGDASLASVGAGLRITLANNVTAGLELARPLTRTPANEGDKDWRSFFSISSSY